MLRCSGIVITYLGPRMLYTYMFLCTRFAEFPTERTERRKRYGYASTCHKQLTRAFVEHVHTGCVCASNESLIEGFDNCQLLG